MSNFNDFKPGGYSRPRLDDPSVIPAAPQTNLMSQLLQSGLADTVQQLVRQQVEQLVGDARHNKRDTGGPRVVVGTDKLEPFDPDSPQANVDHWIVRFDELGERYGWSDLEKMYLLKTKLVGRARDWYSRLDSTCPELLWDEWKKELWKAFMNQRNFAIDLEELVARRMFPDESLSHYFREKMRLCARCDIAGEKAVSCVIHGLPERLREEAASLKCRTSDELLAEFIERAEKRSESGESREAHFPKRGRFSPEPDEYLSESGYYEGEEDRRAPGPEDEGREPRKRRCFNCQQFTTHLSHECPKPQVERCMICGKVGHTRAVCWFKGQKKFFKKKWAFYKK